MKKSFIPSLLTAVTLVFSACTLASAKDDSCGLLGHSCGELSLILENGRPVPPGEVSNVVKVFRQNNLVEARIGMVLCKFDSVEARSDSIMFEITWRREGEIVGSNVYHSLKKGEPVRITIAECAEETILDVIRNNAEIFTIIKSKFPFKIRTEPVSQA